MYCYWLILVLPAYFSCAVDLTIEDGSVGSLVVTTSIAKITDAAIFPQQDQQMLRRIAYAETRDGQDYTNAITNGGIWQLSYEKYKDTKTQLPLLFTINEKLQINWTNTSYSDLRKPLYSALGARLYLEALNINFTQSLSVNDQANYWFNNYTSSQGTTVDDYIMAASMLQDMDQVCGTKIDLMFLLDSSLSVTLPNFNSMKQFVYDTVNELVIGPNNVMVGVYKYGYQVTNEFNLTTYTTKPELLDAINNIQYMASLTFTHVGLMSILNEGFHDARSLEEGVPRVLVVITDGKSDEPEKTIMAAREVHNAGIVVFAIGIAGADIDELNIIASRPSNAYFYLSFNAITSLQDQLRQQICKAPTSLSTDTVVVDTVGPNTTKYGSYPLNGTTDITIKLQSNGNCTLYGSSVTQNPNQVVYEVEVSTMGTVVGYGEKYIRLNELKAYPDVTVLYITVECDIEANVSLTVDNGDTSIDPIVTMVDPSSITEYYGVPFTAKCHTISNYVPNITWYKPNGEIITSSDRFLINETFVTPNTTLSMLTVLEWSAIDEGMYTCFGTSSPSNGVILTDSDRLSVTGNSLCASVDLEGNTINDTSVLLTWRVSPLQLTHSNIGISYYEVNYTGHTITEDGYTHDGPNTIRTADFNMIVTDLYRGYIYDFTVRIKYGTGVAIDSNTVSILTPLPHQIPIPGLPTNLLAKFITNDSIILTWDEPEDGSDIVNYHVIYIGINSTRTPTDDSEDDGPYSIVVNSTELTVYNLLNDYYYQFKVRCRNQYGYGDNITVMVLMQPPLPTPAPSSRDGQPALSEGECTDTCNTVLLVFVILIPAVLVILIVTAIAIILLLCFWLRKRNDNDDSDQYECELDTDIVNEKEVMQKTSTLVVDLDDSTKGDNGNEYVMGGHEYEEVPTEIRKVTINGNQESTTVFIDDNLETAKAPSQIGSNKTRNGGGHPQPSAPVVSGTLMLPHIQQIRLSTSENLAMFKPSENISHPPSGTNNEGQFDGQFNVNLMDQIMPALQFDDAYKGYYEL